MAQPANRLPTGKTADRELARFLARFDPAVRKLAAAVLAAMRKRLPGAVELVYDNYNALVVGFGPTDRPGQAVFSVVVLPQHVSLCFIQGARLADPSRRLAGEGNQVRHVRLDGLRVLSEPVVKRLMAAAVEISAAPFCTSEPRTIVIRSVSAKQRPRRPAEKTPSRTASKRKTQ